MLGTNRQPGGSRKKYKEVNKPEIAAHTCNLRALELRQGISSSRSTSYIVFERNPNPTPPPVTEFEVQKAPCFFCPLPRSCCEDSERQEGLTQLVYSMGASFFSSDSQNDLHSNSQTNSSSHPAELVCPQDPGPADPGVRIPLTTLKGHWHQGF